MNSPRRVWLPWLLLLVPTLLIGAVALRLLWLEQRRIDEAGAEAAVRAASVMRERAQVAADNIELLVAEIRDGLMRELAETPPADLEALLANWPHTNPLVAQTFLWKPDGGGLAWPPADNAEHQAFRARHAELFRGGVARLAAQSDQDGRGQPPAAPAGTATRPADRPMVAFVAPVPTAADAVKDAAPAEQKGAVAPPPVTEAAQEQEEARQQRAEPIVIRPVEFAADEPDATSQFATNTQVLQTRTLRRDVQQQAKTSAELARNYAPASAKKERSSSGSSYAADHAGQSSLPPSKGTAATAAELRERKAAEESVATKGKVETQHMRQLEAATVARSREAEDSVARPKADRAAEPQPAAVPVVADAKSAPVTVAGGAPVAAEGALSEAEREASRAPWGAPASGWIARETEGVRYFLGWWQPAGGGAVRGVELKLAAVLERVQALVPGPIAEGGRFAVRGPGEPLEGAAIRIPLSTTLPGWTLAAWPGAPAKIESLDVGGGFFVVAALLVGAFVVAIVTGGAMFFRQAEAAAREAALKTSFVSNVSHEMKTPLTTIRMYAEMLADERVDDSAKRARYFATIGRETARLTRLVNNALDFGRLEAGRKEYRPEPIALGPWLARLVETYAPRAAEAGVRLVATPPASGAAVRCDPDTLDQMALNLIDNGLKYGGTGAILELHADAVPGGWAIVVADRGPGVPPAHRERIFDRFHRVDDSLTATKQGAGLGLTIARRLARDQGGDLVCHAREGGGAAFVLTLPAAPET